MIITDDISREAYLVAREVYRGTVRRDAGISDLSTRVGMNRGSASDFINNLRHMLNGEKYHRTLNYYATNHYLQCIRADFGEEACRNALSALRMHLDYYDSLGKGRQVKLRALLEKTVRALNEGPVYPDEIDSGMSIVEGARKVVSVNAYERSLDARRKCLDAFGYKCIICKVDFEEIYGEIGRGFIHVHHLVEISSIGGEYVIDPVRDLRPVCPNCHAMLHRRKPAFSIEELHERLTNASTATQ